jgi:hypothetical protein
MQNQHSLDSISVSSIFSQDSIDVIEPVDLPPPKPSDKRKSLCWYFFYPPVSNNVPSHLRCYYCKKPVKYNKDNSSGNLTDHAKNNHKPKYMELQNLESGGDSFSITSSSSRQSTLNFKKVHRLNAEATTRMLIEWIIEDTQAFIVSEKGSFLNFVSSLNLDYKLPKADSVKNKVNVLVSIRLCPYIKSTRLK